jgi:hypothetical protein
MGTTMPKLICSKTINGVTAVRNITTASGNQGLYVRTIVGVGNPFWWFNSIPPGVVIGADFTNAPICTSDTTVNNTLISQITAQPEDVIIYQQAEE